MASIYVPDENRTLNAPSEMAAFLDQYGIWLENWEVAGRLKDNATDEDILTTYEPEIQRLKQRGGYVTADVINVTATTPGLDAMLAKFNKEHTHADDEVRFTVEGSGVFHIHPPEAPVFEVTVQSGDMINVPAGTKHWFNLCSDRAIRCIRLFIDPAGWAPLYVDNPVNDKYSPVCWGPEYLAPNKTDNPSSAVRL